MMNTPLPAMPTGGYYVAELTSGLVDDSLNPGVTTVSTTGRVLVTATVIDNVFEWDESWITNWELETGT
jgi:hypothetical protein